MEKETTYGVWAVRSGASIFGQAEAWCKEDGKPAGICLPGGGRGLRKGNASSHTTANVHYYVKEKEPEPGAVRKDRHTAGFEMPAPMRK